MRELVIIIVIILSIFFGVKRGHNPFLWFLISLIYPFSFVYCIYAFFTRNKVIENKQVVEEKDKTIAKDKLKIKEMKKEMLVEKGYMVCPRCGEEFKISGNTCPYCHEQIPTLVLMKGGVDKIIYKN